MIRKFNFTGRKKIGAASFSIDLDEDPDGVPAFTCRFTLEAEDLAESSSLYLEAYSRSAFKRFSLGTLKNPAPEARCRLEEFQGSPIIRFRFKVIDETEKHGRLLAVADGITPRDPELEDQNRMSLLPVEARDLEQLVWNVQCDQDGPVLEVNRSIEGIYQLAAGDAAFQSLVFPAAIRQILWEIVSKTSEADPWAFPEDWQARWLKYAMRFHSEEPPAGEDATDDDKAEWVNRAVEGFADWLKARDKFESIRTNGGDT